MWYGNKVGSPSEGHTTPTYIFPADIVMFIRQRFPYSNAGQHDNQYTKEAEKVYNVTWGDVGRVQWPAPLKSCTICGSGKAK